MTNARDLFDTISTAVVTIAAVGMVGLYLHDRAGPAEAKSFDALQTVDDWEDAARKGIPIGNPAAPVVITAFMDFQCPYCRRLYFGLDTLLAEQPNDVRVVFQHYPLGTHKFAEPSAIAVECAHEQGRFREMYSAMFMKQDSLGVKSWASFARDAGVTDTSTFARCMAQPASDFSRIGGGRILGDRTGVRGTPTIWVNGNRIGRTDLPALREWIVHLKKTT
jgi:protein-disulfide isomerase